MKPYYILQNHKAVPTEDIMEWGRFFQSPDRIVKQETINGIKISTVFLGIDHSFEGEPLLFETMIFGGEHSDYQDRYTTWEQAEDGHKKAVELVLSSK